MTWGQKLGFDLDSLHVRKRMLCDSLGLTNVKYELPMNYLFNLRNGNFDKNGRRYPRPATRATNNPLSGVRFCDHPSPRDTTILRFTQKMLEIIGEILAVDADSFLKWPKTLGLPEV